MTSNRVNEEFQLEFTLKNLEQLLEWNGRYDNKLLIILGINTAMLGFLVSSLPVFIEWTCAMFWSFMATIVALAVSFASLFLGSNPRLVGPEKSLWYFNSICKIKYQEFEKIFLERSFNDHLKDILQQCHRNSEILALKFKYLQWAYLSLLISVAVWVVAILLFRQ